MKRICIFGSILVLSLGTLIFSNSTTNTYYSYEDTDYFYQQINSHTEEKIYYFEQNYC
jgi:hypothetical protein